MNHKKILSFLSLALPVHSILFAWNLSTIEDFLRKQPLKITAPMKDCFQEEYTGICVDGVVNDVKINNCSALPVLNKAEDRALLFSFLKEAKDHIKPDKKYPLASLEEKLWNPEHTVDFAAIIGSDGTPKLFQMTYIEHLLAVSGFRKLILSTLDDTWTGKAKIEELFTIMLFARALGQTGTFCYVGHDKQTYVSIGLEHPKGGTLAPSGFVVRALDKDHHFIGETLEEEAKEEISPSVITSKMAIHVIGYAVNDIRQNADYYDPLLFKKFSEKGILCTEGIRFVRGLFIVAKIDEETSHAIYKMAEENPGIDFKKEVGVLRFETVDNALKILHTGYNNKQNVEHIVVLETCKDTLCKGIN